MSTTRYDIDATDGWVQVADAGDDFMIEMASIGRAFVTLSDTAPASDAAYHRLFQLNVMVRTGTGAAYVRNPNSLSPITVVVTV